MPVNTQYIGSGQTATLGVSAWSFGGTVNVGSSTSLLPAVNADVRGARLLSRATTASATSVILNDGEFAVMFQSATSCRLCFRSGNTTYTWIATTGAVL
jgi:hypothetical protein